MYGGKIGLLPLMSRLKYTKRCVLKRKCKIESIIVKKLHDIEQ